MLELRPAKRFLRGSVFSSNLVLQGYQIHAAGMTDIWMEEEGKHCKGRRVFHACDCGVRPLPRT